MKTVSPVRIAGAGPAGLSAAINLHQRGFAVEVYERRGDCGARFSGDLQGLENYSATEDVIESLRRLSIRTDFFHKALPPLKLLDGKGLAIDYKFAKPLCYLVKRGVMPDSLDQSLKRQALEAGVKIHFNQRADFNKMDIIATGPDNWRVFAVDKGIRFETSLPDLAIGLVNNKAAFKGYSYLLVVDGYGCICTVLFDRFNLADACLRHTISTFRQIIDLDIKNVKRVGGIGSFGIGNHMHQNQLKIGEAGGLQDLLWGFGIRSAVESGYMAAKCISEGLPYSSLANTCFTPRSKATVVTRYLYEKIGGFGYGNLLRYVKKQADPTLFLYKSHRFTPIHRLLYPLAKRVMKKRYPKLNFDG